ncbi:hypothetical protein SORBI_3010G183900 [Sorghum bicolor]|uniref:Uncharacterized protein n=1 Tax=Sorghum bicolor TaxID=4558 RepID=A0A194YL41_SORBI|nr:hypothetical protein SORBI_3010G183900 [Sorghum bicolor]
MVLPTGISSAKIHGKINQYRISENPTNNLVALINGRRAVSKLPALCNSKGLGCMKLQYISDSGNSNTVACQPPETHITEVFAANCGVELPTVDVISGCHRDRDGPEDALQAAAALAVIRGKEHTQVGAVFDRAHRRKPFFWCLFFTSGSANSTFLLQRSRSTLVTAAWVLLGFKGLICK